MPVKIDHRAIAVRVGEHHLLHFVGSGDRSLANTLAIGLVARLEADDPAIFLLVFDTEEIEIAGERSACRA